MNQIYILSSCNIYKEYSSMKLVMATTSVRKVKDEIKNQIRSGDMDYDYGRGLSKAERCVTLEEDYKKYGISYLNNCLECGHVNIVGDGERM